MDVMDAPHLECYDWSEKMVPLLRHKPHQPPSSHQYHCQAFIFKLAEYVPRIPNHVYNVNINNDYDGDTEDSDDAGAGPSGPPLPPRNQHDHDDGAPPPIQV